MELIIKLVWTLFAAVIVWGVFTFTVKLWRSHVDPAATFNRIIEKFHKEPTDLIATREDDAWYQNGKIVGRVIGKIVETPDSVLFAEVADTSNLRQDQDIEFRRLKLRLERSASFSGMKIVTIVSASGATSSARNAVLSNAECRIVSHK
jgi:hypothetical protein